MKKLCVLLFLLLIGSAKAQDTGALLLFATLEDYDMSLHLLDLETDEQRFITDLEKVTGGPWASPEAGWSPDGRIWTVDSIVEEELRLRFYDAESGEESLFPDTLLYTVCGPSLSWSPTGERFGYLSSWDNDEGLTVANTVDETRYTLPWIGQRFPFWSPDGAYMYIIDNYYEQKGNLLSAADGKELMREGTDYTAWNFAFSPDSRFFAYQDETVWLYELSTGETINLESVGAISRWSPTGRYLLIWQDGDLSYYDVQTGRLTPLDLDDPVRFAAWSQDETSLLLYADFQVENNVDPRRILSYDMASGESETFLETEIPSQLSQIYLQFGQIYKNGDWIAALSSDPEQPTKILLSNGKTRVEAELKPNSLAISYSVPAASWSPDGRWFVFNAEDGIYRFDTQTSVFERLPTEGGTEQNPFWSPDSQYLAFKAAGQLTLWNVDSDTIEVLAPEISHIIGWQSNRVQQNALYCTYGDGNV